MRKWGIAAVLAAGTSGLAGAKPAPGTWVDMGTGSSRVFVDTSSITGKGQSRSANVIIVDSTDRRPVKFEFDCAGKKYRIGSGNWQGDDPGNVRKVCERDFKGLKLYSRAEIGKAPLAWKATRIPTTAPGKWILVDWTRDQMVLVDPASIKREARGYRFKALYQIAGQGGPAEYQLAADCPSKRIYNPEALKTDNLLGSMLGEYSRLTSLAGSTVNVVLWVTFCYDRPVQLHDAPGVDREEAIAARASFEAARRRYLQEHPGADLTNVITHAPGPKALGGYQLSLIDIALPSGLRGEVVGEEQNRTLVQHTWKHPFSAVGHLFALTDTGSYRCTATLVGNNRTLLTARHCANGTRYRFALGNAPLSAGVPAKVVAFGDFPLVPGKDWLEGSMTSPDPEWDDWMVLDLDQPVNGEPLAVPTEGFISKTITDFKKPYFHVAGFPADIREGEELEKMTYTRGCGISVSKLDYKGARTSRTACAGYKGSSGSALLVLTPELRYVPVGVLSGGPTSDTSWTILMLGGRAFDAIRAKVAADCRARAPGVRFHPGACTQ